jgi:hypothetical protein
MAAIFYIPAASEAGARAVVAGIETGCIPCLPEYLDAEKAAENFDSYPRGMRYRLWAIERRTVDDGRIFNVWPVDRVGDIAAALLIVIGGCFAVAHATLL